MTPLTLNVRDVAQAALKAHSEKRLSAQGPTPHCRYRDSSGHPCAIGAAIDDKTAKWLDSLTVSNIYTLIKRGDVLTDNSQGLQELQRRHDSWSRQPHNDDLERKFLDCARRLAGQ
ncbi:hypothetical protein CPT_Seuss104 [Caulobacter phage Seuss]|uniref:Uncharacterized protein n=1 Tax=Caulobacter phage Seuss TaxID=1675601 RepID=A0A0K1LNB4_9CAUD|nr:hypothetical protein HOR08_gp104 [Caulobacter phage Seuss]AKU43630.1 hypothetical protein CPT_Seuss104 [Caulobacter phage Seuss]